MSIKIFTVAEMVAAEKAADAAGHSYDAMMEQAGQALADAIIERYPVEELRVLVLVGPGNNGGDGLVAGRYLAEAGADVAFYLYKDREPEKDANYRQIQELGLFAATAEFDQRYRVLRTRLAITDLVIDALLGTGVSRPIGGDLARLLKQVASGIDERRAELTPHAKLTSLTAYSGGAEAQGGRGEGSPLPLRTSTPLPVVAVDCPSGLNCDTGALDPLALPAALTVTFAGAKRGHFIFPGAAACGELVVADIGIDPALPAVAEVALTVATAADMRPLLPERPADGHKGTFGTALITAGSHHYWGAPVLAASGATRTGAGLVALAVPGAIRATAAAQLPAATYPPVPAENVLDALSAEMLLATAVGRATALLIGPGLDDAGDFLDALLAQRDDLPPLVVDADGLNLLAQRDDWPALLPANSVLTPHPGEMARLMAVPLPELKQRERVALAQEQAQAWGHTVLLKGAYTVVAAPDGRCTLLPFANPALAVGGSGDVLSGVIVALLAQGVAPFEAAVLGGWLHAAAAELYPHPVGLRPDEIADYLPQAWQALINNG